MTFDNQTISVVVGGATGIGKAAAKARNVQIPIDRGDHQ